MHHGKNMRHRKIMRYQMTAIPTPLIALLAAVVLGGLVLGGCDIAKPEMPTFTTNLSLPLGEERLDVLDAIDGEEYLVVLADDLLGFHVDGDPDTVALDFDLAADIDARVLTSDLGDMELDLVAVPSFDFVLGDLYPAAMVLDGMSVPVPSFTFDVASPGEDLAGVNSLTVSSGTVTVTLVNGLPVPVSGTSVPEMIQLAVIDPASGGVVVALDFDQPVIAGGQAQLTADLRGVVLPGTIAVRITGGSPGSGGVPVLIDAQAAISADVAFSRLVIHAAEAEIPAQHLVRDEVVDLPADYGLLQADIETGMASVTVTNHLPVPCQTFVTWLEVRDAAGDIMMLSLDLAPGEIATATADFAGATITAPGVLPITALTTRVELTSPGSEGNIVTIPAGASVSADLAAARLVFGTATGTFPAENVAVDPVDESIDLPDELDGLTLTAATLTLNIDNSAGVGGLADLLLTGTSEADVTVAMPVQAAIAAGGMTTVVLTETNSAIADFINNLPVRVTLEGSVSAGGPGEIGTVSPGDRVIVDWDILAPVEVVIDGAELWGDPEPLDLDTDTRDLISDHALDARVLLEVENHLPVAVEAVVLFSADSTTIKSAPLLTVGPVSIVAGQTDPVTLHVSTATVSHPVIELTAAETKLLATENLQALVQVRMPSTGGEVVRVRTTDYVTYRGMIQLNVEVSDEN